jgi:myo-inositol 2-dehydrogenase/D-chiro-inositol 1-dehydrogenase
MSTRVLRVGVVGAGNMGAAHARQLHRWVSGAEVVAVADADAARAAEVAVATGASSTVDPLAVIADPDVEAVVIASPDATHPALVRACVEAGKPVLCEKPLAPTLPEAAGLLAELGDRAGLVSLGFMRRFDQGYQQLRATIRSGELGAALVVHCIGRGVASYPGTTDESTVSNSTVHDLDIVPWLLDSPVVEAAWCAPRSSAQADGFQDPQLVLLRTADQVVATVETFLNARYGYDTRCEVVCETGASSLVEPAVVRSDAARLRSVGYPADWRPRFADAYRRELTAWVEQVTGSQTPDEPVASARDGVVAAAVADAVVRSMHDGGRFTTVELPPGVAG